MSNSQLISAAIEIANWTADAKVFLLREISGQMGNDEIFVTIPGYNSDRYDGRISISGTGGVVVFQEFLQQCANLIEEVGQTLGLSDKEVKELKQMLGMV